MLLRGRGDELGALPGNSGRGRALHAVGVDQLITMPPLPDLYDDGSGTGRSAVDVWVLLPKLYDQYQSNVQYVQGKGDKTWSYNCCEQDDYSPKWLLDFDPINYRVQPGFINESLGLNGLLYWRVDWWTSDPWNNVQAGWACPGRGCWSIRARRWGWRGKWCRRCGSSIYATAWTIMTMSSC